jgi:hypothetical protein
MDAGNLREKEGEGGEKLGWGFFEGQVSHVLIVSAVLRRKHAI